MIFLFSVLCPWGSQYCSQQASTSPARIFKGTVSPLGEKEQTESAYTWGAGPQEQKRAGIPIDSNPTRSASRQDMASEIMRKEVGKNPTALNKLLTCGQTYVDDHSAFGIKEVL